LEDKEDAGECGDADVSYWDDRDDEEAETEGKVDQEDGDKEDELKKLGSWGRRRLSP
jgi:hypothetical protein